MLGLVCTQISNIIEIVLGKNRLIIENVTLTDEVNETVINCGNCRPPTFNRLTTSSLVILSVISFTPGG